VLARRAFCFLRPRRHPFLVARLEATIEATTRLQIWPGAVVEVTALQSLQRRWEQLSLATPVGGRPPTEVVTFFSVRVAASVKPQKRTTLHKQTNKKKKE
jgi:hypothetical protein